jgi:twinkle protein
MEEPSLTSGSDSHFLQKEPCPSCGSRDNLARYSDGHGHCFGCGHYEHGDGTIKTNKPYYKMDITDPVSGEVKALPKRALTEESCKVWDYKVGTFNSQPVQIANYRNLQGEVIAQKLRFPNKEFTIKGESSKMGLYGMHLWKDGGKMVIVTEGELDAISVSQIQSHKWPVVSIPHGAQSAVKSIAKNLEYLERFETVVFMFDNDQHGIKAAKECASMLSPSKAKIATLSLKDANEMLVAGKGTEVIDAIWRAKAFRPDGIVGAEEMWDSLVNCENVEAIPYPFIGLNDMTHGLRRGELVTVTAGSGIGKSQLCREIAHWLVQSGQSVGYIALEESVRRTVLGMLGIHLNKPLHLDMKTTSETELKQAFDEVINGGKFYTYDHFGSMESENLLNRIRYMARGCGCGWIFLDHLSIVVSSFGEGDERRMIDNVMTKLRSLVEELKIGLILVSHLKRPDGRGHEEGASTSLSQLRGSAGIAQLSDMVLGLERNQQDAENKNQCMVRVLKNRFSGETGLAATLLYSPEEGRLRESAFVAEETTEDVDSEF